MHCVFNLAKPTLCDNLNVEGQVLQLQHSQFEFIYTGPGQIAERIVNGIVERRYYTLRFSSDVYDLPLIPIAHEGVEVKGYAAESHARRFFFFKDGKPWGDLDSCLFPGGSRGVFRGNQINVPGMTAEERTIEGKLLSSWKFVGKHGRCVCERCLVWEKII